MSTLPNASLSDNNQGRSNRRYLGALSRSDSIDKYSSIGWRMLPVNGKKPSLKKWPEKATSELSVAREYLKGNSNIGIATGRESGIVVIDIDPRNGGELGLKSLEKELGTLPKTVTAQTGGGGLHYIFKYFEGAKKAIPANGVDFLADGQMFVAAPSIHPESGEIYSWLISPFEIEPAELPEAWISRLLKKDQLVIDEQAPIPQGERNNSLMAIAGKLKADGNTTTKIKTHLLEENAIRCVPPLKDEEIFNIVESISKYDAGSGRSLKTAWQEAILFSRMSPGQKITLLILGTWADEHGRSCYPTQEQIAERSGSAVKTIRKYLKAAEEDGWFKTYTRPRAGTQGFNYGYILSMGKNHLS